MSIVDVKASLLKTGERDSFALVKIFTDDGIMGFGGQNIRYGNWVDYVNEVVKPILINEIVDPFYVEKFSEQIRYQPPGSGTSPRPSCVEIALWDIIGKVTGQPIYRLFGAVKEKVKAYLSISPVWEPKEMAKVATEYREKGFRAIKFHSPTGDVDKDLLCIKAVRDAVSNEIEIMVDGNMSWSYNQIYNFRTALKMAKGLERYEGSWFEEPLPYERRPDLVAKLTASVDIPISGGGQVYGVHRYKHLIENDILDIVQPDTQHCGGLQEARKIALLAEAFGKLCIPHSGIGPELSMVQNIHVSGCSPNSPFVEYGMKISEMVKGSRDSLLTTNLIIDKDGYIEIPKGAGLGVELNEMEVARLTLK